METAHHLGGKIPKAEVLSNFKLGQLHNLFSSSLDHCGSGSELRLPSKRRILVLLGHPNALSGFRIQPK